VIAIYLHLLLLGCLVLAMGLVAWQVLKATLTPTLRALAWILMHVSNGLLDVATWCFARACQGKRLTEVQKVSGFMQIHPMHPQYPKPPPRQEPSVGYSAPQPPKPRKPTPYRSHLYYEHLARELAKKRPN
jgi:hypothetical protein